MVSLLRRLLPEELGQLIAESSLAPPVVVLGRLAQARRVQTAFSTVQRLTGVRRSSRATSSEHGQALVEFAIVLPILLLLLFGLVEFSFVMNTSSSVNYASRDAAMLAAEGGSNAGADCIALQAIERDLVAPALPPRVQKVEVYWSDANGAQIGAAVNLYDRTGSTTCDFGDGTSATVPYTLTTPGYPEGQRCDVLAGCGGAHTSLDTVGVRITYQHQWATAFGQYIAGTVIFNKSTAIRMEPQL